MRFLPDERLYRHTEDCLRYLRERDAGAGRAWRRERYHVYWHGTFGRKQAFAVKSFLATQDLERSDLWLWLDRCSDRARSESEELAPLLPFLSVQRFDTDVEVRDTPLTARSDLLQGINPTRLSNFVRHLVLYRHGGTYVDIDTMFLRDMAELGAFPEIGTEFCSRWSAHMPYANSAFLRLEQGSETGERLLLASVAKGSARPREILRFDEREDLDLVVLPPGFFDPLWAHVDGQDHYADAPFDRFRDFFRRFGWRFRKHPAVGSHRDFFPGAFAYHWHNCWEAREHARSYAGLFEQELDVVLHERLGLQPASRRRRGLSVGGGSR